MRTIERNLLLGSTTGLPCVDPIVDGCAAIVETLS